MHSVYFSFVVILQIFVNTESLIRYKRIVGGIIAAPPPPDDPVVFARMYNRDARVEGFHNKITGLYSFLGIRYAEAPVGEKRFSRPRYRRLEGDISAKLYGPPCAQPDPIYPQKIVGEEDCLLLNVFTPQMPDETTGLPVYVWIHGGGFRYGSAAQYGAEPLTQAGVIFVPVQYRLGSLGIVGDGSRDFSGNLAMLDMTAALRWVTEYISFFGGDPKQVKLIGHGSGAASAQFLSMSKLPRSGSINGVVSMSGSALSQYALDDEPVQGVQEIAMINDCPQTNNTEIVKCLRKKSFEDIISRDLDIQTERLQGRAMINGLSGGIGFNPHLEMPDDRRGLPGIVTDKPQATLTKGSFSKIPLLIGVTKDETGRGISIETINRIYGSSEKFLNTLVNSLSSLKEFLNIDQLTGDIQKPVLPGAEQFGISLKDFLKVPVTWNPEQIFTKLTETTTEVLFNLPAVLTAELWGRIAPSFLYSFEYAGKKSNGEDFLNGLPIVGAGDLAKKKVGNIVSHGDELGYLFDVNDILGNPIEKTKLESYDDLRVRKSFTELLANFARLDVTAEPGGDSVFQKFSKNRAQFIKINSTIVVSMDFRFCQLSLWGAPLKAFKTVSCQVLNNGLGSVSQDVVGGVANGLSGAFGIVANPGQLGLLKGSVADANATNAKKSIIDFF